MIEKVGGKVKRAVVTHVTGHTFFAELHVDARSGRIVLDSRPSDAIAVALRTEAGIFVEEGVFDAVGAAASELGEPEA